MKLNLKKGGIPWIILNSLEIAALLVLGILSIVFRDNNSLWQWTVTIGAILVIIDASLHILFSVVKIFQIANVTVVGPNFSEAIGGSSELAIGILMVVIGTALGQNDTSMVAGIFKYVVIFAGIAAITVGAILTLYATVYLVKKIGTTVGNLFDVIVGVLLIVVGILILVFRGDASPDTIIADCFMILGIVLIVLAVLMLLMMIGALLGVSKDKDVVEGEPAPETIEEDHSTTNE